MTRNSFVAAALAAGFGIGTSACTPANSPDGASDGGCTVSVGKAACEVEGEHVAGDAPATLAAAKGKIVIVDFWATWCDPCKKSFPQYQELVNKHAGELFVIAVSVDDPDSVTVDDVKQFAHDHGDVSFAIVWDRDKVTSGEYKPETMPTSYVIDKEGRVQHIHVGFKGSEVQAIDAEVEALIK